MYPLNSIVTMPGRPLEPYLSEQMLARLRPTRSSDILTSSTAAELHPTQCRKRSGAYSTRVHKFSLHVTVVILLISHIPQWRILMYEAYARIRTTPYDWSHLNGIRPSLGRVRSHSAEYVVCSRHLAMPLHIRGSVGRIRPYTGGDLLGRIRLYSPLDLDRFFIFLILYTAGRTPWMGDEAVTRPLPTHRINAHRHPCFEWDSNLRPHCPRGEDSSCLRPHCHCIRLQPVSR
jgi:hypothetical protein